MLHEGNRTFGLFCLFEGKGKVSRTGSDGKEQIIRLAKEGDTLGYRSLLAHATQVDPESPFWFVLPAAEVVELYPWEDYILADSHMPTETPEFDLFAGIAGR